MVEGQVSPASPHARKKDGWSPEEPPVNNLSSHNPSRPQVEANLAHEWPSAQHPREVRGAQDQTNPEASMETSSCMAATNPDQLGSEARPVQPGW